MLLQKILEDTKLIPYLCDDCEENGIGISFHSDIQKKDYTVIKIDTYFNKNLHPNPAGNDCLIVQKCADNRYKLYLIELKNIETIRNESLMQIRDKFQNCFDVFMSDEFRTYFYDLAYEYSIQLLFVSNLVEQRNRISDKKQKNTRLDSLLALPPCRFANKRYGIELYEPFPIVTPC
jgi:hypothetical protein